MPSATVGSMYGYFDEEAISYYSEYGFTLLPDSGRMFMSIKKIEEALETAKK